MMVPVAAVIILLSVFNGFGEMISEMNRAVEGDLTIESSSQEGFKRSSIDAERISEIKSVEAMSFVAEQMVLLRHDSQSVVARLRGVDEEYAKVISIENHVRWGRFEVAHGDDDRLVVGSSIAGQLGIKSLEDSDIEIVTIKGSALQSVIPLWRYKSETIALSGVVITDEQSDASIVYTSDRVLQRIGRADSMATKLMVRLAPQTDINAAQKELQQIVGDDLTVLRREQLDPATYDIVRYEKLGITLISMLVMIVASFSLFGAMTMLIIEKQDDIATLRAMGASMRSVKEIFLMEGGLISAIAIGVGVVIGVGVTLAQQHLGIIELPSQSMVVNYYPVKLMVSDLAWIIAIAVSIAAAVSWLVVDRLIKEKDF